MAKIFASFVSDFGPLELALISDFYLEFGNFARIVLSKHWAYDCCTQAITGPGVAELLAI